MNFLENPVLEQERIQDLHSYSILDSFSEEDFDNLTTIASQICGTSISLISLIDNDRQWFKAKHNFTADETPREFSFCAHAINQPNDVLIVEDARADTRFQDNPLVNGSPNIVFYAGVPLVSEAGYPLGSLCVIDEKPKLLSPEQITSLKALSKQAMNLMELRKKKIQLEKAEARLQEKNANLEQFAVLAAHDLKSPLYNISSLIDLIESQYEQDIREEVKEILNYIKASSTKLKDLIEGLLAYSRSDQLFNGNQVEIKLSDLQQDITCLFRGNKNSQIRFYSEVDAVYTNKAILQQILVNLVANAIKYNNKKMAEIEIGVTEQEEEYLFYVKDNGPGIAPKNHERIFRIFETLLQKDQYGERGNGIGLATVKKIIERSGGTIRVESEVGQGATFIFTLKKPGFTPALP
ncbi:GAF domain-containing protein [Adhaeribacter swui]|uniref:histidine kinase n=1 Tax=Adhaeribacter swui TaxID=2086471 RepID=A0A7G7GBZ2_9BACT|nr:ATP-binding protein [Adhaeribacter swui]QNF34676.1 GAF domain-containing protein [Adhaeribacter swui]